MTTNLGIISAADIAYQRFLPALQAYKKVNYKGFSSRTAEKAERMQREFGGKKYTSYDEVLADDEIDCVYIPLPPALHYEWGEKAIKAGKHIFMEKPFAYTLKETIKLLELAKLKKAAVYENYAFLLHSQLEQLKQMIYEDRLIGDIRLVRINFSFPKRGENDFRYQKLGGGACLDCGGYPIKLVSELLGRDLKIVYSKLNYESEYEVDLFGSLAIEDDSGCVSQLAFGMDNGYHCELEVIGQFGTIRSDRIFTAPPDFAPRLYCDIRNEKSVIELAPDNQFLKAIEYFVKLTENDELRKEEYDKIYKQAWLVQQIFDNTVR